MAIHQLTRETVIRLLIGAESGSLDKILHTAGIEVTASAVSQRRAQIDPIDAGAGESTWEVRFVCGAGNLFLFDRLYLCKQNQPGSCCSATDRGHLRNKVNFKMAATLCKEYIRTPKADGDKLMKDIARYTVPVRSDSNFNK